VLLSFLVFISSFKFLFSYNFNNNNKKKKKKHACFLCGFKMCYLVDFQLVFTLIIDYGVSLRARVCALEN